MPSNGGEIDIWIDKDKRNISFEENRTGITEKEFETTLQAIAQSDKQFETESARRFEILSDGAALNPS